MSTVTEKLKNNHFNKDSPIVNTLKKLWLWSCELAGELWRSSPERYWEGCNYFHQFLIPQQWYGVTIIVLYKGQASPITVEFRPRVDETSNNPHRPCGTEARNELKGFHPKHSSATATAGPSSSLPPATKEPSVSPGISHRFC